MADPKPLFWIGSSRKDLMALPDDVRDVFGFALYLAQTGGQHSDVKAMRGMGGGVVEVVEDHRGDTYRAVYTVKLEGEVNVLHAFQKKSKKGIATPKPDLELIKSRLKLAAEAHEQRKKEGRT